MKLCPKCGAQQNENAVFCNICGYAFDSQSNTNVQNPRYNPYISNNKTINTTGQIVWSVINMLLCSMPLGIAALIFACLAQSGSNVEDAQSKLKISKILNIVATSIGAAVILIIVLIYIFIIIGMLGGSLFYLEEIMPYL